jgi:DnaJ-class molecular chaperone
MRSNALLTRTAMAEPRPCAACDGARVEVVLNTVIPCGRCKGTGTEPAFDEERPS